jgi:hypothetical protein
LWIVVQERVELKKSKYWTYSCTYSTYNIYVLLGILFNLLPTAHEAVHLHLKPTVILELLGLVIYKVEFRIYPTPVLGDSVHLRHQPFKVLSRRLKISQRLSI